MNKKPLLILLVIGVAALYILVVAPQKPEFVKEVVNTPTKTAEIIIDTPKPNDVVSSPLVVKGRAKGTWYFEGSFPVTLYYGVQDAFVSTQATALGEWMTEDYVDFEVTINFPIPPGNDGLLVFEKDNPSDLRELDDSLRIPLRFH